MAAGRKGRAGAEGMGRADTSSHQKTRPIYFFLTYKTTQIPTGAAAAGWTASLPAPAEPPGPRGGRGGRRARRSHPQRDPREVRGDGGGLRGSSAAEMLKLLAQPERVLVEERVAQVHRRPLVEVTVEHSCCREGRGVRKGGRTPTFAPPQAPQKGQDPTRDPTAASPYPAAGKQTGSAGLRSTRSGWSPASAGSEADGRTDRNKPGVSLGAAPHASGPGEQPP